MGITFGCTGWANRVYYKSFHLFMGTVQVAAITRPSPITPIMEGTIPPDRVGMTEIEAMTGIRTGITTDPRGALIIGENFAFIFYMILAPITAEGVIPAVGIEANKIDMTNTEIGIIRTGGDSL